MSLDLYFPSELLEFANPESILNMNGGLSDRG